MSSPLGPELVVNTGPLCRFAEAGWLSALRSIANGRGVVVPDTVEAELRAAVDRPHVQQVLNAGWIEVRPLESAAELRAFSQFARRLVVGERNVGEAAVLAYASVHSAVAVIDDGAGRRAARDAAITLPPTLSLLCEGIREELFTVAMVNDLVNHLLETEYRLPFPVGGFERWARENSVIP